MLKEFDNYCMEKRAELSNMEDGERKDYQEKLLVARSLLHREATYVTTNYSEYKSVDGGSDIEEKFSLVQEALFDVIDAGLRDTPFDIWKAGIEDAISRVLSLEEVKRLPRFVGACEKIVESLDVDFSDVEDDLMMIFEPECVYNTLVLMVTAVKLYSEILHGIYDNHKGEKRALHKWTSWKVHRMKKMRHD